MLSTTTKQSLQNQELLINFTMPMAKLTYILIFHSKFTSSSDRITNWSLNSRIYAILNFSSNLLCIFNQTSNQRIQRGIYIYSNIVFLHIRPAGIIILCSLQMRVLLENITFLLHKVIRIANIIRVAGIIRGRTLYEEIR